MTNGTKMECEGVAPALILCESPVPNCVRIDRTALARSLQNAFLGKLEPFLGNFAAKL